ncbi:MAG TPA: glycosyltransferase family 2 protein, partial [Vicinamibacteria bacterium]|nr:glycosyltransferase family 2 protein [Vicinamibacteria bacterium]
MIGPALDVALSLAALPVAAVASYLAVLAAFSRRLPPPPAVEPSLRFEIVVPAHDEEAGVAATVANLHELDYPAQRFRVFVVADNCTDRTAEKAREAGAQVLVRNDPSRRGKGYALAYAFERLGGEKAADAIVVVDADTLVSRNLLRAFAARLAAGETVLQAEYGPRNPDASWRTRLMRLALTLFHGVRSLGRERLGLSCGLRGNGMCFASRVLREVPHDAFSIVEDLEYGVRVGLAGHRVAYVPEAEVQGEMAASEAASRSQRRRWEGGRLTVARQQLPRLLRQGLRQRRWLHFDLAADLVVPPLATVVLASLAGILACAAALLLGAPLRVAPWLWASSALGLAVYVGRGLVLAGSPLRSLRDLAWAPVYVAWKIRLAFSAPTHA